MALRRMVPTNFFKDPDIMNLGSKDTQLILVGLILDADDEGRGVAHAQILGREMDYPPETIEHALQDLAANDLLALYQAGRHRYYSLPRWHKWQTINRSRMTPSKYPAPPPATTEVTSDTDAQEMPTDVVAGNMHADSGEKHAVAGNMHADSGERSAQCNVIESKTRESNSIQSDADGGEPEAQHPPNVVIFPTLAPSPTRNDSDDSDDEKVKQRERDTLNQIARILHLPPDEALLRIVQDYGTSPALSLLGEADAAREWIDDPRRNKKRKQMTPAFFRRWLQREHNNQQRQITTLATTTTLQQQSGIGNDGASSPLHRGISPGSGLASRSLMDLEHRYKSSRDSPQSNTQQTKRDAGGGQT